MNQFDQKDVNYIAGFEAGCEFIVHEIEQYMRAMEGTEGVLAPLLRHLRADPGKSPTKKSDKAVDTV